MLLDAVDKISFCSFVRNLSSSLPNPLKKYRLFGGFNGLSGTALNLIWFVFIPQSVLKGRI